MKKYLILLIAVSVLLQTLAPVSFAAGEGAITVDSVTVTPGTECSVPVRISGNPGTAYIRFTVTAGSGLAVAGAENGDVFADLDYNAELCNFVLSANENTSADGVLLTLKLNVSEGLKQGSEIPVSVTVRECYNDGLQSVALGIFGGVETVGCPHLNTMNVARIAPTCVNGGFETGVYCLDCNTYISGHEPIPATGEHVDSDGNGICDECHTALKIILYGDANGDRTINTTDVTILKRYLAGFANVTLSDGADVNGDGTVSNQDTNLLQRYLSGYNVTLG